MKVTSAKQLIIINLLFLCLTLSIAFLPVTALRIIFGLPALFFFPGYTLLLSLYPTEKSLDGWERVALSLGLSFAIVPLIGLALNYTPWGIRLYPFLFSIWVFVALAGFVALFRQRKFTTEQKLSFHPGRKPPKATFYEMAGLLLVMLLGYGLTFIPHLNYPYPLHVDEWMHLAYSRAIQEVGSTAVTAVPIYEFPDFFTGAITLRPGDVEPAFHVLWAISQGATGISWLAIFRFFPGVIFVFAIFSVYVFARRAGYGLEAAFLASLMPTNATMLGPSLLVPVALGLMFLPLSLLLVLHHRTVQSYVLLVIFIGFLALMHLATAVILTIIFVPFIIFQARKEWKHRLAVVVSTLIPLLVFSAPIVRVAPEFAASFTQFTYLPKYLPYLPNPIQLWGFLPAVFFAAGVFLLARRRKKHDVALLIACLLLLFHNLLFIYGHLGAQIIYHRSSHHLILLMSLVGGYALCKMRNFAVQNRRLLSSSLFAVIIGLVLVETMFSHVRTQFYHMIDNEDYAAFAWIEQNVPESYRKAVLDPWRATAFMALSRREVYSRIQHAPQETDNKAWGFLRAGSTDTDFLRSNGISIVYSRNEVRNDDLVPVRYNVFLLPEMAQDLSR